jgi:ubiquinone/menaquinone biosynthesis C-methylase UbiE
MAASRVLSHDEARRFYDRFGARQDSQAFYEAPALADLVEHLELARARAVVELGCGTGRFAASLLRERLPPSATYLGIDVSTTMVELARRRLAEFGPRAEVRRSDGSPRIDAPDGAFDRYLSTFVLDLLSPADIGAALAEAHRVLEPGGLLGLVGLTSGERGAARAVSWLWTQVHRLRPALVGGCRPLEVLDFLPREGWKVRHRGVVAPYAIASEILVAERI